MFYYFSYHQPTIFASFCCSLVIPILSPLQINIIQFTSLRQQSLLWRLTDIYRCGQTIISRRLLRCFRYHSHLFTDSLMAHNKFARLEDICDGEELGCTENLPWTGIQYGSRAFDFAKPSHVDEGLVVPATVVDERMVMELQCNLKDCNWTRHLLVSDYLEHRSFPCDILATLHLPTPGPAPDVTPHNHMRRRLWTTDPFSVRKRPQKKLGESVYIGFRCAKATRLWARGLKLPTPFSPPPIVKYPASGSWSRH